MGASAWVEAGLCQMLRFLHGGRRSNTAAIRSLVIFRSMGKKVILCTFCFHSLLFSHIFKRDEVNQYSRFEH